MKKTLGSFAAALFGLALVMSAQAADMSHGGHDMNMNMDQQGSGHQGMDHGQQDQAFRRAMVDGYQLAYELIDMKAGMAGHAMPAEMKSHHLMVYIVDPQGQPVAHGKVGYLVTGPDGEQKAMTMPMSGGYGADVDFEPVGTYTVKTKVVAPDGKKLMDEFTYEAK